MPRWVTGIPAQAGTATALVTPGTTSNGIPARAHASASSPPRPNRQRPLGEGERDGGAQPFRPLRVAAGGYGDGDLPVPGHRGCPGGRGGRVVGAHTPDPQALRIGGDTGVDGRVVRGGVGQP